MYEFSIWVLLTHKQLVLSTVATDAVALKHQATSIHNAY